MFFCEFYEIFKNTYFQEHLQKAIFEQKYAGLELLVEKSPIPDPISK